MLLKAFRSICFYCIATAFHKQFAFLESKKSSIFADRKKSKTAELFREPLNPAVFSNVFITGVPQ